MIPRALTLAAGLTGAAACSQFPEYAQQYTQRLGGAVHELTRIVADFDASAEAAGLTRAAALDEMRGTAFLDRRRADMSRTIARSDRLRADLALLRGAGPFTRAYHAGRFTDPEIARAALRDYKPALPMSVEGVTFAAAGFLLGTMSLALISAALRRATRRKTPA